MSTDIHDVLLEKTAPVWRGLDTHPVWTALTVDRGRYKKALMALYAVYEPLEKQIAALPDTVPRWPGDRPKASALAADMAYQDWPLPQQRVDITLRTLSDYAAALVFKHRIAQYNDDCAAMLSVHQGLVTGVQNSFFYPAFSPDSDNALTVFMNQHQASIDKNRAAKGLANLVAALIHQLDKRRG